jgi:hypothetical protein
MYFFLLPVLIGVVGLLVLLRLVSDFRPGEKKLKADLRKMRAETLQLAAELTPVSKEELDLFATEQVHRVFRKRAVITAKGVFTTIYHEPVAAYSYKRYVSTKLNALLFVRTAEREYVYRFHDKEVQIIISGKPLGTVKSDSVLYSAQDGRMIGGLRKEVAGLLPVVALDRELGSIASKPSQQGKSGLNSRAFAFVKDNMNEEEETLFLSLAFMELVKRSLD